jgi:hypothetical protein
MVGDLEHPPSHNFRAHLHGQQPSRGSGGSVTRGVVDLDRVAGAEGGDGRGRLE